jgi:hypothetical protein
VLGDVVNYPLLPEVRFSLTTKSRGYTFVFDLAPKSPDGCVRRIARHVDDRLMAARVIVAKRNEVMHALGAHVCAVHSEAQTAALLWGTCYHFAYAAVVARQNFRCGWSCG